MTESEWKVVSLERPCEGVAVVTLTDPSIRNHGSWSGIGELAEAMRKARTGGARIVVLASGVPGHWFEHAWLTDLRHMLVGEPTTGEGIGWFQAVGEIVHPEVISIAAISGDCSGGGAELGWACDLRVAEEQVQFGQPEVQIGLGTGLGGSCRLARLIGRTVAAEMVFDGAPMPAQRIYELGGINRVVPTNRAIDESIAWAKRLASRPAGALSAIKRMLNEGDDLHLTEALANEQQIFQESARTPGALEGIRKIQARFDAGEAIRTVYGPPNK